MISFTVALFLSSTVIADFGNTQDLERYITFEKKAAEKKVETKASVLNVLDSKFPISTKIKLAKSGAKYDLPEKFNNLNVALVGDNNPSLRWLKNNYKKIKDTGALVVVIDVESKDRYAYLSDFLSNAGLEVALLNSELFDEYIKAYPVLIQNGGVTQ